MWFYNEEKESNIGLYTVELFRYLDFVVDCTTVVMAIVLNVNHKGMHDDQYLALLKIKVIKLLE